jgi:RecJ-like exonuclease
VELGEFASWLNAAGRLGEGGWGIAACLGDSEALARTKALYEEYNAELLRLLRKLELEGRKVGKGIQYFYHDARPALAGACAELALRYLFPSDRPMIVLSRTKERVRVSGRGMKWHVEKGIDLATALQKAASTAGGVGGGHAIAAGASIPPGSDEKFLAELDRLVSAQLGLSD